MNFSFENRFGFAVFDIEFELVPVSNGGGKEFFGVSGLFARNIFRKHSVAFFRAFV